MIADDAEMPKVSGRVRHPGVGDLPRIGPHARRHLIGPYLTLVPSFLHLLSVVENLHRCQYQGDGELRTLSQLSPKHRIGRRETHSGNTQGLFSSTVLGLSALAGTIERDVHRHEAWQPRRRR